MKRTVGLLMLIAMALLLSAQLLACGGDPEDEKGVSVPPVTGEDGANLIKSELSDVSLSYIADLFVGALGNASDLGGALASYSADATLAGGKRLALDNGVISYSDGGELKFAAAYGAGGLKAVTRDEGSDAFVSNGDVALWNTKLSDLFLRIKDTLVLAEEHYSLPNIQDADLTKDGDGVYYLSDEYIKTLLTSAIEATLCASEGVSSPSELDEAKLTEIRAQAAELAEETELGLGFGLKMKKIRFVHIKLASDSAAEYTDGRFDSIECDVRIELDSQRTHVESADITWSSDSLQNGKTDLEASFGATYDKSGTPLRVGIKLDAALTGVVIGEEKTSTIKGCRTVKLGLEFNPYSSEGSIDLDYSDIRKREADSEENYYGLTLELGVGAIVKNSKSSVELKYGTEGEGQSPVSVRATGKASFGEVTAPVTLPDEVKSLLGIERTE